MPEYLYQIGKREPIGFFDENGVFQPISDVSERQSLVPVIERGVPIGFALEDSKDGAVKVEVTAGVNPYGIRITREEMKRSKIKPKRTLKIRKPTRREWRGIIDV